jgi:nucleotide-binding universal stress UspA family protein
MFKHILVATDGSDLSAQALRAGVQLAKSVGADLSAVFVMPTYAGPALPEYVAFSSMNYDNFVRDSEVEGNKVLDAAVAEAKLANVTCRALSKRATHAYEGIIEAANENACDLIIMASHGRRGVSAMVLGSETNKVLTHSKIPVLVYR